MRWKAFIPVVVLITAICVITIFFLDGIIKTVIIKNGESIFKAKVDLENVDFKLLDFSLQLDKLAIADKDNPWTNLVEVKSIRAQFMPLQLLEKKFIVEDMSVEGMSFGGKRSSSGELKKVAKAEKKEEKKVKKGPGMFDKLATKIQLPDLKELEKKLDVKKLVKPENLMAVKRAKELEAQFNEQSEKWKGVADEFKSSDIEKRAESLKDLSALKIKSIEDIPKAKEKIDELKNTQQQLKDYKNNIKEKKEMLTKDVGSYKGLVKELDKIKSEDLDNILKDLNISSFDVKNISQALFGPVIVDNALRIKHYYGLLKKYIPARNKKDKKVEVKKERFKGRDILFPKEKEYPGILIGKISVSGIRDTVSFSGKVLGVNSDPALYGKPTKIDINGKEKTGEKVFLTGLIDHTKGSLDDNFNVGVESIKLKGKSLGGGEYLDQKIEKGEGMLNAKIFFKDNFWEVDFLARSQDLKLIPKEISKDQAKQIIDEIMAEIDMIEVKGNMKEIDDDLKFSFSSNIDELISQKIKALFGKKIEEAKAKLRKELDSIVDEKKKELLSLADKQKEAAYKKIAEKEEMVQQKIDLSKSRIEEGQNDIKKKGEEKVEKEKEKLKEKGKEELKKLFKF
ncbi:MAG: TIGR03545 family protein [bacterium]